MATGRSPTDTPTRSQIRRMPAASDNARRAAPVPHDRVARPYELLRIHLLRLYEKSSNTRESPRHEANHGSVHQRLAARTQPLVVFAHTPVLVDPSYRPLHHPPAREHHEALGGMNFSQSSFAPSLAPSLAHSLAHLIITSSGAGFLGRSTSSTLHPKVFSVPNPCPCLGHGSPRPITGDAGEEIARPPCAVGS